MQRRTVLLALAVGLLAGIVALALTWFLTQEFPPRINVGMTRTEVETLLGDSFGLVGREE